MSSPEASAPNTRKAGQHARERARQMTFESAAYMCVILICTGLAGVAWGVSSPRFLVAELLCCGGLALINRRDRVIDQWQRGAEGEVVVGRVLEGMRADGWHVLHDVSFGAGNIDHVVIGPGGLFAIETKSHPGRIPAEKIDERMLKQAWAEKKKLEEITGEFVKALLVFSRAYLQGKVPCRRDGVIVLPARMLAGHLQRHERIYTDEQAQALYERLGRALG